MGEPQTQTNVIESLRLLRSEDPVERKQGIMALSVMVDDARVMRVFEHLYENDPHPGVRQMAWRAINRQGPSIPAPGPVMPPPAPSPVAPPPPLPSTAAPERGRARGQLGPFLLDPANGRLLIAQARQPVPARGGCTLALAVVAALLAGIVWGLVLPGWITEYRLDRDGIVTEGEIIRLYVEDNDAGDYRYYASYRFPTAITPGETLVYRMEQRITAQAFASTERGQPITVTHLPGQPDRAHLSVETPEAAQRTRLTWIAAGLSAIVLLLLLLALVQRRSAKRSRRRGELLWGEVVRCVGETDMDRNFTIRLQYRFRTPQGKVLARQASRVRNDLITADLPEPGTPVVVYYRSESSYRVL